MLRRKKIINPIKCTQLTVMKIESFKEEKNKGPQDWPKHVSSQRKEASLWL